jgi:EAL and modified HD-GYP domain-containing signal transduction protein
MLIGTDNIRRWVSIWALTGLTHSRASEVVTMAIIRARCCEQLGALRAGTETGGELFLLGLCSMLDVLLERHMSEVLKAVSVPRRIAAALLGHSNLERHLLDAVIAYERGDWAAASAACTRLGVHMSDLASVYPEALQWATALGE